MNQDAATCLHTVVGWFSENKKSLGCYIVVKSKLNKYDFRVLEPVKLAVGASEQLTGLFLDWTGIEPNKDQPLSCNVFICNGLLCSVYFLNY